MTASAARSLPTWLLGGGQDFTLLWVGEAVSSLGSAAALIAYPLLTLAVTGSASGVGVVMAVAMVSQLAGGLPGGVLVDRVDRRRLMIYCDAVRAIGQAGLVAGLATHHASLFLIGAMAAEDNAVTAAFTSAQVVAVRHIVPSDRLPLAIARTEARDAGAMLAGPPLGGLLFAVMPWLPFAFNCASYLASFCCITLIRTSMRPTAAAAAPVAGEGWPRAMAAGLRSLWRVPFLRVTSLLMAGTNLASNSLILIAVVAVRQHGASSAATGVLLTLASVGSLTGALLAPAIVRRLSVRAILVINRAIWVMLIPVLLAVRDVYAVGAVIGAMFVLGPSGTTAVMTRRMALTPENLQGRVSSASSFCVGLAAPLGTVAIGFTLAHLGLTPCIVALTGWMALLAVIAVASSSLRPC